MEDNRLFLQGNSILEVKILENTQDFLKLEVVRDLNGNLARGTVFRVDFPLRSATDLFSEKQSERIELL